MRTRRFDRRWFLLTVLIAVILALVSCGTALAQTVTPDNATPAAPVLTDKDMWAIVVGYGVVWIAALINKSHWPSDIRYAVFFGVSVVAALGNCVFNGTIGSGTGVVRSLLVVLVSAIGFYMAQKGAVQAFEARTTSDPPPAPVAPPVQPAAPKP